MDPLFEVIDKLSIEQIIEHLDYRDHGVFMILAKPSDVTTRYIGLDCECHLDSLEELLAREIKLWQPETSIDQMTSNLHAHLPEAMDYIRNLQENDVISPFDSGKGGRFWTFASGDQSTHFPLSLVELYALTVSLRQVIGERAAGLIEAVELGLFDPPNAEG